MEGIAMNKKLQIGLLLSVFLILGAWTPSVRAQNNVTVNAADSLQLAQKHLSFGNNYLKNKQYEDAETQLLKAWAHLPTQEQTLKKRTQCARLLGRLYHETEKYDGAIQWYQQAVVLGPLDKHNKNAYRALGTLYMYQEKSTEAIGTFEKLLRYDLEPATEIEYLYHIVVLSSEEKEFDRALQYANRWAELTPDDARVRELLGKLHLRTGDEETAIAQMEKVMDMNPDDFKTLNDLATRYQSRGEFEKAFDAYERLHKSDAQNFLYLEKLRTLSKQLQTSNTYQLDILQKMHQRQPKNLSIIETLAEQTEDVKWIQKGFQIDSQNGHLQYLMGEIYHKKWKISKAVIDSSNAIEWYQKVTPESQWGSNAEYMINVINPPKTKEEQIADDFFNKAKKNREEIHQEGKK
ncbi:MAG: tetratricopeptide (TPR) repeat protein [Candidatus Latescibacterota bacterium]|jgi:tetratricopeptide (TPR) repeat protein